MTHTNGQPTDHLEFAVRNGDGIKVLDAVASVHPEDLEFVEHSASCWMPMREEDDCPLGTIIPIAHYLILGDPFSQQEHKVSALSTHSYRYNWRGVFVQVVAIDVLAEQPYGGRYFALLEQSGDLVLRDPSGGYSGTYAFGEEEIETAP